MPDTTLRDPELDPAADDTSGPPQPGALLVFGGGEPRFITLACEAGEVAIGRDRLLALGVHDPRVSRRHALVEWGRDRIAVRDEGSSNGTYLDGRRIESTHTAGVEALPCVLRVGQNVLLLVRDVAPFERAGLSLRDGVVVGTRTAAVHEQVASLARAGMNALFVGESGCGKEVAARVFHASGPHPGGPFVGVNCATVPRELAERLLFGARRGAYSGAVSDSEGYVQSADGGTLFLDELAELDAGVQAKLLRVLETREVTPLGATRARTVDVRVCAASGRDLRAEVEAGRFREDLYYRIARPAIVVPPLRERPEEVPWLLHSALEHLGMRANAAFVETCLLRRWPGNVRELFAEVRAAAVFARRAGAAEVEPKHLAGESGNRLAAEAPAARPDELSVEESKLWDAIEGARGNVQRAAVDAGVSRARLRRFIEKHAIDVAALRDRGRAR